MATYAVQAKLTDPLWSVYRELPTAANALGPYTDHMANLAIFNRSGSKKHVHIVRATCSGASAGDATTVPHVMTWQRCSAATMGQEMLTPIKLDSANDNLPSQVKVYGTPSDVTLTSSTVFYERIAVPPAALATALATFSDLSRPYATQHEWLGNTDLQKITLREGEGLCLHTNGVVFAPCSFEVTIRFRKVSNGHTYQVRYAFRPDSYPIIALMNESSSGVVLEVSKLIVQAMAAGDQPWFSCEKIEAMDVSTGVAASVVPMDPAVSLPSGIEVRRRVRVAPVGVKSGAWIPFGEFSARGPANPAAGPNNVQGIASGLGGQETVHLGVPLRRSRTPRYEVILNEGEGFAWFDRAPSGLGSFDVGFVFLVEDMSPKEADVRFGVPFGNEDQYTGTLSLPSEDDVRLGIEYGGWEGEFTGNVVIPAEGDVRLGTDYGANGTEYEGTLDPGSGGGGKRRIRGVW